MESFVHIIIILLILDSKLSEFIDFSQLIKKLDEEKKIMIIPGMVYRHILNVYQKILSKTKIV